MVFLDISKAFDKVWQEGLIYKLEALGVRDLLLHWIKSYLPANRKQRVMISSQYSAWKNIGAGVPQGSVLGPLLFLVYINDITSDLSSYCFLFADDTSLLEDVNVNCDAEDVLNGNRRSHYEQFHLIQSNCARKKLSKTFCTSPAEKLRVCLRRAGRRLTREDICKKIPKSSKICYYTHICTCAS